MENKTPKEKILILGIGNPLFQDDGVGPYIIKELRSYPLPKNIYLQDGGTGGFGLVHYFQEYDNIIVIDAVDMNTDAGTIRKIKPEQIKGKTKMQWSLHQTSFSQIIELAEKLGKSPNITIFGVQPRNSREFGELSPEVKISISALIIRILEELRWQEFIDNDQCKKLCKKVFNH
jgi:hydrogenase maturation protease